MTTAANESPQQRIMYTQLPAALLPKGFRGAPSTPRGGRQRTTHNSRAATAVGVGAANRLTEFVRGVLGARGDRAAAAAMESRLERKVLHLENVVSGGQTEAQNAGARAGRAAGSGLSRGLSGKQCKKRVSRRVFVVSPNMPSGRNFLLHLCVCMCCRRTHREAIDGFSGVYSLVSSFLRNFERCRVRLLHFRVGFLCSSIFCGAGLEPYSCTLYVELCVWSMAQQSLCTCATACGACRSLCASCSRVANVPGVRQAARGQSCGW